jgi:hypothetical protein
VTQRIDLSHGQISPRGDELRVQLVRPTGKPEMCVIMWPAAPTVCRPARLADMVATITRVLSNSVIDLAARRY